MSDISEIRKNILNTFKEQRSKLGEVCDELRNLYDSTLLVLGEEHELTILIHKRYTRCFKSKVMLYKSINQLENANNASGSASASASNEVVVEEVSIPVPVLEDDTEDVGGSFPPPLRGEFRDKNNALHTYPIKPDGTPDYDKCHEEEVLYPYKREFPPYDFDGYEKLSNKELRAKCEARGRNRNSSRYDYVRLLRRDDFKNSLPELPTDAEIGEMSITQLRILLKKRGKSYPHKSRCELIPPLKQPNRYWKPGTDTTDTSDILPPNMRLSPGKNGQLYLDEETDILTGEEDFQPLNFALWQENDGFEGHLFRLSKFNPDKLHGRQKVISYGYLTHLTPSRGLYLDKSASRKRTFPVGDRANAPNILEVDVSKPRLTKEDVRAKLELISTRLRDEDEVVYLANLSPEWDLDPEWEDITLANANNYLNKEVRFTSLASAYDESLTPGKIVRYGTLKLFNNTHYWVKDHYLSERKGEDDIIKRKVESQLQGKIVEEEEKEEEEEPSSTAVANLLAELEEVE